MKFPIEIRNDAELVRIEKALVDFQADLEEKKRYPSYERKSAFYDLYVAQQEAMIKEFEDAIKAYKEKS